MKLETVEEFEKRTEMMSAEGKEQAAEELVRHVVNVLEQKRPIHSIMSKELMETLNDSYIRHLSEHIGFFGVSEGAGHEMYMQGHAQYKREVREALVKKASATMARTNDSPDLKLANEHLATKWDWICKGLFGQLNWTCPTPAPLVTQTFIKNLDVMISDIADAFEEVC